MAEKNGAVMGALALGAAFVLVTGGYFLGNRLTGGPCQVITQRQEAPAAQPAAPSSSQSQGEAPESLLPGEVIDINTAGELDLQRLPGIGEKRARDIVAYREEHGPFQSVDQLDDVSGIGEGILSGLRDYVTAGQSGE